MHKCISEDHRPTHTHGAINTCHTQTQCLFNNVSVPFSPLLSSVNYDKTGRSLAIRDGTVKSALGVLLHVLFKTAEQNRVKM